MKSIIFPINNKGGVGKTSLLVDLMTMLSLNYKVGLIDTDPQATFYSTITGDDSKGSENSDFYLDLETITAELHASAEFKFAQGSKRMKITVNPSYAKASIFPIGMIKDFPESIEILDCIVKEDMREVGMIGVDLPPVSHPKTCLEQTLMPIIESSDNPELFPLIITTPEKNTIDIGLKSYSRIKEYLLKENIPEDKLHPIVIINKVLTQQSDHGYFIHSGLDKHDRVKLRGYGIIFDDSVNRGSHYYEFRNRFKHNGVNLRSIWMPFIEGLRGGDFCLLKGKKPEFFNLPEIFNQVTASGYRYAHKEIDLMQGVYSEEMNKICNFIKAHSKQKVRRNYSVHKHLRKKSEAKTRLIRDIRTSLEDIYQMWEENPDNEPDFYKTGEMTIRHRSYNLLELWIPKKLISLEKLAQAISDSEEDLGLKKGDIDEEWKPGDYEKILFQMKNDEEFRGYENELLEITTRSYVSPDISEINIKWDSYRKTPPETQKERFDVFLGYLDKALKK